MLVRVDDEGRPMDHRYHCIACGDVLTPDEVDASMRLCTYCDEAIEALQYSRLQGQMIWRDRFRYVDWKQEGF